ncbi:MAG: class I SAM-dependent methyltransferase [Cyanobacteria bacterium P01_F01_bin.53]
MSSNPTHLLVDAHVHLHDCFEVAKFLEAARSNFEQQSQKLGLSQPVGILLLTECSGVEAFDNLVASQSQLQQQLTDWDISTTEEATSLRFTHRSGQTLLIMAGRQVVTEEGIEVLTLITEETVTDGLSLEKTVQEAITANSLPVLPWGVGKWIGKRGELVEARLGAMPEKVFAGDNGGRPGFWPLPGFCQEHRQLPGTDPLPLEYEVERPGSFGFSIQVPSDWNNHKPGESLKQLLQSDTAELQTYGRSQSPFRFVKNQSLLRLNKPPKPDTTAENHHSAATATSDPAAPMIATNNSFPETADIESSTDAYASRFAGPIGEWLLKIQLDATLKMLKAYPNASVLEVGGGHGQLTSGLLAAGHSVTVVGSDEVCKHRIRDLVDAGKCNFQVANILEMPYEDDAFDVVISYRMLAHVEQWQPFMKELSRVAKKAVMVDYPTLRSANYITPLLFSLKKGVEKNTRPYTCYNESELLGYAKNLGLKVGDRYAQFFWPMVLHRMMKQPGISSVLEGSARVFGLSRFLGSPIILKLTKQTY